MTSNCPRFSYGRFDSSSGVGVTNTFDGFGRLASQSINLSSTTRTLAYQYDRNGNRTRITHPDGNYFRTWYDPVGRPYYLDINSGPGIAFTHYAPHGGLWVVNRDNGSATAVEYDDVQRPDVMAHNFASPGNGANVYWTFDRNPASQLTSAFRNNDQYAWTRHYGLDRAYATNGLNQYEQTASGGVPTATFDYDANGNLISDGTFTFGYDIENRLISRSGGVTLSYDPLGRLFSVTSPSTSTRFLYDGDALVVEYNASGDMTRRYVHNVGADVPMLQFEPTLPATTLPPGTLGTPSWLHGDERGSIVAISPASGAPAINSYDEYGIPALGNTGRFQYTGQIWLPELGMYHYKARVYSPTHGRFLQTDPVGYEDQYNLYAYAENDPINATDPSGMSLKLVTCGSRLGVSVSCSGETVLNLFSGVNQRDQFRLPKDAEQAERQRNGDNGEEVQLACFGRFFITCRDAIRNLFFRATPKPRAPFGGLRAQDFAQRAGFPRGLPNSRLAKGQFYDARGAAARLRQGGYTRADVQGWQEFYARVYARNPGNESAFVRSEMLRDVLRIW